MEAMVYVPDEDQTPGFVTVLWRFMQTVKDDPMSRKEMASRLEHAGFKASENNVTQWLNGLRLPPPGLPYYSTIALNLDEEDGQLLAWAYSRSYKDNRKGAGRSGLHAVPDKERSPAKQKLDPIPDKPGVTIENEAKLDQQRAKIDQLAEEERQKRRERENGESTSGPSSRA